MAELSNEDRGRIWRGLMRFWSNIWELIPISKGELRAAVDATDDWIGANQASFNATLPAPARNALSLEQKTLLFCAVALARVSMAFLKQILGEVE